MPEIGNKIKNIKLSNKINLIGDKGYIVNNNKIKKLKKIKINLISCKRKNNKY